MEKKSLILMIVRIIKSSSQKLTLKNITRHNRKTQYTLKQKKSKQPKKLKKAAETRRTLVNPQLTHLLLKPKS